MIDDVIESYKQINEEMRLQSTLSRKVEFYSTIDTINLWNTSRCKVLDIGCGVGIYSLHLARCGFDVTAIDVVPEHIKRLKEIIHENYNNFKISAFVGNATDLSEIIDNEYDIVLCMGPLYHLIEHNLQIKCIDECIRVSKKDATLYFSYISPYSVFPCVIRGNNSKISLELIDKIIDNHYISNDDKYCFWTDNYFHSPDEMKALLTSCGLNVIDHLASDGQSIAFQSVVNSMNEEEFQIWMKYHKKICRNPSIIGTSNHGLIVAKKG